MTSKERVTLAINRKQPDRVPIHDDMWGTSYDRWQKEGMPQVVDVQDFFGFDLRGIWCDNTLQLPCKVIEETEEFSITTSNDGETVKNWKTKTSTPELIDFTIKTREIWEEHKPRAVLNESRVNYESAKKTYDRAAENGFFLHLDFGLGFTRVCSIVGPDRTLMAMVDDPEWIQDMFMTDSRLCVAIAEELFSRGIDVDAGWIFDDLGFKQKGFFSAAMYKELLWPAHKLVCDVFKSHGKPMILHSCGFIEEFIPLFIEAGFDCIQPLEVKAGNDMLKLKKQYGDRLAFMGGIDVRAMANPDPSVIEKEISTKIPAMKQGGGYIYHSDHSVPDNISYQQYQRTLELVREYGKY
jgi:uroporphyrinogen decarboxylase